MSSTELTLYSREGCHLCDLARDQLQTLENSFDFVLTETDIEQDHDLHVRLLERIPVLAVNGQEVLELEWDADDVVEVLQRQGVNAT